MGKIIVSCKECNHKAIIEKPDESLKSFLCTMCGTRQKALPSDFVEVDDSTKRKNCERCGQLMPLGRTINLCSNCAPKDEKKIYDPKETFIGPPWNSHDIREDSIARVNKGFIDAEKISSKKGRRKKF